MPGRALLFLVLKPVFPLMPELQLPGCPNETLVHGEEYVGTPWACITSRVAFPWRGGELNSDKLMLAPKRYPPNLKTFANLKALANAGTLISQLTVNKR